MNADGSNPRALTGALNYAQGLVCSPDGSWLAFDHDADNDYWNELAVIAADGSGLRPVLDVNQPLVDLWAGGWSFDGRQLVFTLVAYVVRNNQLYPARLGFGWAASLLRHRKSS